MATTRFASPSDDPLFQAFREFWSPLTDEERAKIIKATRPELHDVQVARLCGVHPRTLRRMDHYRQLKEFLEAKIVRGGQFQGRQRRRLGPAWRARGFSHPDQPVG